MKQSINYLFAISILFFTFTCLESAAKQKKYSLSDIISNSKAITLSDLGIELETINLTFDDGTVISDPNTIITTKNEIYILAKSKAQVYRFGRDGKFLNKISTMGRAKNEYNHIVSIFVDNNNNICVNDMLDRILTFTPDGKFLGSRNVKETFIESGKDEVVGGVREMYIDKEGNLYETFLALFGWEPNNLVVTNSVQDTLLINKNPIRYKFSYTGGINYISDDRPLFYSENDLICHPQFSDTVYTVVNSGTKLEKRYVFINDNAMPIEEFSHSSKNIKNRTYIADFSEDNKYLYLNISDKNKEQLYLIDKKTGKSFKADFNLNNPNDEDLAFYPKWESNNEFIFFHDVKEEPEPTIILMKKF